MNNDDLPVIKGACAVIDTGTEWVLQVRDNIDGILWPGKIALWGGAMDPEDGGSFEQTILRELYEEVALLPDDIELIPVSEKTSVHSRTDGEHGMLQVKIFIAKLSKDRALHVYEGEGLFRIEKAGFPDNTPEQHFGPYVLEVIHQLHHMRMRSVEV